MSSRNIKTRNVKDTSRPDVQVKRSKLPPLSAADFAVGPQNKYVRPQSAFQSAASTNQILREEESETTVRPNTAPTGKVLRGLSPETPSHRRTSSPKKELKKSHLTPVPKDGDFLSSLYYDFPGENEGRTKKRNSHTVFAGNQFTDGSTTKNRANEDAQLSPVFDGPKEAWPIAGVTTVIVSPPEDTAPSKPFYKQPSYEKWLAGPELDSDEYDTDLEEDFPKAPEKPIDPTGKYVYEEECQKLGLVPVSYISRHLADRHLGMRHHYLGGERTLPIAEALKNNTVTEALDLTDNYIEGCGAYCIADMINTNLFIVSLNLSNNFLKTEGAKAIAEMLESNTTLKSLSLSGNQLTDLDCRMFVEPLKNNMSLTSLDLSHNEIGDIGVSWIASALVVNEGIVELDLSWNAVQQKGASALGNTLLKNQHLEVLDLSWNGVGMHGVAGMAKGLRGNHKLRVLDLSNNRLETKAMANLCPAVRKNTGLETLILNLNPMKEAGLELLLKAVSDHPTLKFLSVEEVVITRPIYEKIEDLREKRDLIVVHGEVGGYQRFTARGSVVRLFKRFLCENRHHLEATLRLQDKDREGVVTMEELKIAFRESGIRLTNKQLELLLAHGNLSTGGYIHYSGLLDGSSLR